MNTEEIIQNLGGFGRFQKLQYFFFSILWIGCGAQALLPVFILYLPPYRCAIPGWRNDTFRIQSETHASCLNETIPFEKVDGRMTYSHCHVYNRNDSCVVPAYSEKSPGNTSDVKSCTTWVYDNSSVHDTAATQMNFVCDKLVLISVTNMVYMSGLLVGSLLFGILSDRKGRKLVVILCILINIGASLPLYFVNNIILLNVCRFFTGIATNGIFSTCFILSMEMVTCSWRSTVGLHSQNMYALGEVLVVIVCYFVNGWRHQCLVIAILLLPTIGFCFGIYESPRWLIGSGKFQQAEQVFCKVSQMNGIAFARMRQEEREPEVTNINETKPEVKYINETQPEVTEIDEIEPELTYRNKNAEQINMKKLLQSKVLFLRFFILAVNWAAVNMVYQGLMLDAGNLSGNLYLNALLSGLVEFPAYIFLLFTIDKWGRKPLFCASMLISGASCIISALANIWMKDSPWFSVTFAMIGKFAISSAFGIIFNLTTEIFPTVVRSAAMGINSCVGKTASLAAPYLSQAGSLIHSEMGSALPMILFGIFTVLAGMMSLVLPETQGQKLPETIEDGENLGRKKASIHENDGFVNQGLNLNENC